MLFIVTKVAFLYLDSKFWNKNFIFRRHRNVNIKYLMLSQLGTFMTFDRTQIKLPRLHFMGQSDLWHRAISDSPSADLPVILALSADKNIRLANNGIRALPNELFESIFLIGKVKKFRRTCGNRFVLIILNNLKVIIKITVSRQSPDK